ncbi:hypothetical protein ABPG75_010617 [Micractinium tetrahymenae]
MEPQKSPRRAADLPAEVWVQVASFLSLQERLSLALVCKHLFHATRRSGAALWESLSLVFSSAAVLRSFDAWRRRCECHPQRLLLHHSSWQDGEQEQPRWEEVVATVQPLLPSLQALTIRWEGEAVAGDWLCGATRLQDLGLFCGSLMLLDALGSLTTLKELSVEGSDGPLLVEPAALPASLTKLLAVDSHMVEAPEALSRTTSLQSLYLSRNPLSPTSLSRLATLPRLELLSLIGCWFSRPPVELSALTSLRALYLDYNGNLGDENENTMQDSFSAALGPLTNLEALGLSHNYLDSFPEVIGRLTRLKVLYLESNPGIARLPAAAAGVLSRLQVLSCDAPVLFSNANMFARAASRLQQLFVSGSGLMWHVAALASTERVLQVLAGMPALKKLSFVVQTQREEAPSVEVAALMLELPRRRPALELEALDSEQFFGITLADLEAMAAEDERAAAAVAAAEGLGAGR